MRGLAEFIQSGGVGRWSCANRTWFALLTVWVALWLGNPGFAATEPVKVVATILLHDSTPVVGILTPDPLEFESPLVGRFLLPASRIRALEWKPGEPEGILRGLSGEELRVRLHTRRLRVKTNYGEARLPASSLYTVQFAPLGISVELQRSLVSVWSAEGNAKDSTLSHSGKPSGGVVFMAGKLGSAFCFATSDARVHVPDSLGLNLRGSFGLAGWMQVSQFPAPGTDAILCQRGAGRTNHATFTLEVLPEGALQFSVGDAQGPSGFIKTPIKPNTWYHVVACYNEKASQLNLFLNGKLAAEGPAERPPLWNLDPTQDPSLCLGNAAGKSRCAGFRGMMDEWSIFSRDFMEQDAQALMDLNRSGQRLMPIK